MPTSDLLGTGYFGNQAAYVPTSLEDNITDSFEATLRGRQPTGYLVSVVEEGRAFSERNEMIRTRFGRDIGVEVRKEYPQAGAEFLIREIQSRTDQLIDEGRGTDPEAWKGVRKAEEIEAVTRDRAQVAQLEAEKTMMRAEDDFARYGGAIIGGVGASFLDPINLATLPIGAGAGVGILRAALLDGALNVGVEAAQAPFTAQWQRELGFKYGLAEAGADMLTAGAGGTALSAMIRGGAKGLGKLTGRSEQILRDIAMNKANKSEVRAAAHYMERVAHVDENIPPLARVDDNIRPDDVIATHRSNLAETQESFRNYREPLYNDDIPFDVSDGVARPAATATVRVFESGEAVKGQYTNYTQPSAQELRYMEGLVRELEQAEKGNILRIEKDGQGSTPEIMRSSDNTFPDWFRQLNREGESVSRDYVNKVFEKIKEGKPLGKKEVRVAEALFDVAQTNRSENVRQILNFRQARSEDLYADAAADIDALAARELAREMADPYLEPLPDAARTLADDIKAGDESQMMEAANADFARLLDEDPDFSIAMEDGSIRSMRELADDLEQDDLILEAVTVCGVG